ncbi:carbohydrate ABC transporter permease [Thorsellia anophelis]|uniref:Multiple sugar transport system permease protein n=1 Tax=Thorsellia anophelis DSM 18579 TaxID=1123402 RepID=A0A1I0DYU3_9GAMM|nr:sugar ABC transporter permease [Thorsellia anophelis]SET37893.1 multiple sugar transport system permease protein [Thorsellia anophelis DSM 18579]
MMAQSKTKSFQLTPQAKSALMFFSPAIILLTIFTLIPVAIALMFSMTNYTMTGVNSRALNFIGFENFTTMFEDPDLGRSILNTLIFTFCSAIVGQQVLGFTLAYLMRGKGKNFRRFIGICVLAGWVTPELVASFNLFAFFAEEGTLNYILSWIGIRPIEWLFTFPMVSIIIANIWRGTAFSMMIYEAALADLPDSVEEAARIDGASKWQIIYKIILPIIKNTATTNMILVTLQTIGVFGLIFALTGGGPGGKTETLSIFIYKQAFVSYQVGYGVAISLFMLLLGIAISLLYIRSMRSDI